MRIKNKLFPYPVLREESITYATSSFDVSMSSETKNDFIELKLNATVNNPEIRDLIIAGDAKFAFHLECQRTYYRKLITSQAGTCEISIKVADVDRILEVCPMILATRRIEGFKSGDLIPFYQNEMICFEPNDVMAIGKQTTLRIIKNEDVLKKLSAMFFVDCNLDPDAKTMTLEPYDRQVCIWLPKNDFARFFSFKDDPRRKETLFAALFFPALIGLVDIMKSDVGDEHEESLWYELLSNKGDELGIGSVEKWGNRSSFEIAQILFEYPMTRYLKELAKTVSIEEASV